MSRPEHTAPPEVFYNEEMAEKYASSTRMIEIQSAMAARCVELLNIPPDSPPLLLLDIGCGSGLSGQALGERGHRWVGVDISRAMLGVAKRRGAEAECGGDLLLSDIGDGVPFRAGVFDGAISVSALQWLCNADKATHNPIRRMRRFFETLFAALKRSARAIFQVYPETPSQMEMLASAAMRAGFTGGLLIDYPNSTRAKKYYLTLFAGPAPPNYVQPAALGTAGDDGDVDVDDDDNGGAAPKSSSSSSALSAKFEEERKRRRREDQRRKAHIGKPVKKSREWILQKKDHQRALGLKVREDTKYTGRKRHRAI